MDSFVLSARQNHPPAQHGPPYASHSAALGGLPTIRLDVPLTSVFLFLFLVGGVGHMTLLQINLKRGHKFTMSGAMFGFCLARVVACTMRIVWANKPTNIKIGIAASIFVAIGDIVGFVVNLNLAQRIIRALHPRFGWHRGVKSAFIITYCGFFLAVVLLIAFTVLAFFTLDPAKLKIARRVQLYGATYFAIAAFLPLPMVFCAFLLSSRTPADDFGRGQFRSKVLIVLYGSLLLAIGAWFRVGTEYPNPRPVNDPAPYQSKACFYIFYFTLETLVIWTYLVVRIDRRFHVPNGSKGPGDYSRSMSRNKDMELETEMEMTGNDHGAERESTSEERAIKGEAAGKEQATEVAEVDSAHVLSDASPRTSKLEDGSKIHLVRTDSHGAFEAESESRASTLGENAQHEARWMKQPSH